MDWRKTLRRYPYLKWAGLGLLLAVIILGVTMRQLLAKPAPIPVLTNIEKGDVVDTVEATGTVDAVTTVNVGAQISGRIDKLYVDFNSVVQKGQLLAHIEDTPFVAAEKQAAANVAMAQAATKMAASNVEAAQTDLAVARANLARDEALARKAKIDYERTQGLYQSHVSPQSDLDQMQHTYEAARAAALSSSALVEQAQARVKSVESQVVQARAAEDVAKAALAQTDTNVSYTRVVSPIDGTVVARNIDVGQTVASSLATPNLFNIAQDLTKMYVYTKLDVRDVPKVQVGQNATFTVDAYPNATWEGTVIQVRISPITQLKGQTTPSQLGSLAAASTSIPGLQTQSSSSGTGPAGGSAGSTASGSSSSGGSSGGSAGNTAASVSPSTVPAATQAPGLVQYDCLIAFTNTDRTLLPGMDAYVTIPISAAYNVLRVRKEALRSSPSISLEQKNALLKRYGIEPGQPFVWFMEGEHFRPVPVTTGKTDYLFAEITGGNVQPGQRVLAGYQTP